MLTDIVVNYSSNDQMARPYVGSYVPFLIRYAFGPVSGEPN